MTPANERKAAERQRRKEAGLVRVEVWVKPEHRAVILAVAQDVNAGKVLTIQETKWEHTAYGAYRQDGTVKIGPIPRKPLTHPAP